ncbi:trypsin-like peptidase domain-containing protein [Actinomadura sp. NTSP31]|uniref:trypsin-like peptidase domain-containing protein n=1 Tax=Actinomadura sp. NTSP31 TaxID=1735447 RepID=UPI0035BF2046
MTHAATPQPSTSRSSRSQSFSSPSASKEFLGRILGLDGEPVGTCFQVAPGYLVSARHVVADAGGGQVPSTVGFTDMSADGWEDRRTARLECEDEVNDLVLLRCDQPLPASISHLALSKPQAQNTEVWLGGFAVQQDSGGSHHRRYLETTGRWEGLLENSDRVVCGVVYADGTALGMSGCPILRTSDNAVIGVLSHRYRGEEQWGDNRVWVSQVEDLVRLCTGVAADEGDLAGLIPLDRGNAPIRLAERGLLAEAPLDQQALRSDTRYLQDPAWSAPWTTATRAMHAGEVLLISGPPGVGTTTFARRVLAHASPDGTSLIRLDPGDWDTPSAAVLPRRPHTAYLLELRDPDSDRPTADFLHDLSLLAPWWQSMRIQLIITVAEELWRGQRAEEHPHLRPVYLQHAPDPVKLARHRLTLRHPELAHVVDQPAVHHHLADRNAVQTMDAVAVILQEIDRLTSTPDGDDRPGGAASSDQPDTDITQADQRMSTLVARVAERLDDHGQTLDVLFTGTSTLATPVAVPWSATIRSADRSQTQPSPHEAPTLTQAAADDTGGGPRHGLAVEERCLLIALAARNTARLPQLETDARRLKAILLGASPGTTDRPPSPLQVLSGGGLRGRIHRVGARVGPSENVTFRRTSFGPAALRYVWDNYEPVRRALTRWLIGVAGEGTHEQELVAGHLSELLRRHQDVGFIKTTLAELAIKHENIELLTEIVFAAATDEHMQRRCERLLYDWSDRPERQQVVVEVCGRLLQGPRRSLALRRLRRVADTDRTPPQILGSVLERWRRAADSHDLAGWFRQEATAWIAADSTRVSARLAFTALLTSTAADGMPWLLSAHRQQLPRADEMLGEVLVSVASTPGVGATIAGLVERAADDDELYARTIDQIVKASVANGLIRQLWDLETELQQVGARTGRDPRADIQNGLNFYRAYPAPPPPLPEAAAAPGSGNGATGAPQLAAPPVHPETAPPQTAPPPTPHQPPPITKTTAPGPQVPEPESPPDQGPPQDGGAAR